MKCHTMWVDIKKFKVTPLVENILITHKNIIIGFVEV